MRVLFLTPPTPDYLADGVLHGLRTMFGDDVVDTPKAAHLYPKLRREALAWARANTTRHGAEQVLALA